MALEGNLEGDAVDRDVFVFLPPSYAQENPGAIQLSMLCTVSPSALSNGRMKSMYRRLIEGAFAQGVKEMIVVLPDSKTLHNDSTYSSSVTTGDERHCIQLLFGTSLRSI